MRASKNTAASALNGIWAILLLAFVIAVLYVGKEVLIPLALAALITFLLAPLVGRLERWIGRIAAVLLIVLMLFALIGGIGWMLTRQAIDLADRLPDYQANIQAKVRAFRIPTGGLFSRITRSFEQIQKELPSVNAPSMAPPEQDRGLTGFGPAEKSANALCPRRAGDIAQPARQSCSCPPVSRFYASQTRGSPWTLHSSHRTRPHQRHDSRTR
jgi:hypothetical protein